ncbi:SpoIIE family protein phosphatase [Yinghuangia seranimata]|uniref:SpoIIE family protein phosphatase n=1 Tax=Yinghuangia seranimata TaxID=408067 RepID=UPI00248AC947|nr:SpoIIE family protein phosphatase [Yinghuangia seranimata]MDI2129857.1 SpoIIE family protein phosphatase [Yinghuangia seranimata]
MHPPDDDRDPRETPDPRADDTAAPEGFGGPSAPGLPEWPPPTTASLLHHLLDQAPIGICMTDTELRCVWVNEALVRSGGVPREERLGKRLTELFPDLPTAEIEGVMRRVLATGVPEIDREYQGSTHAAPGTLRAYSTSFFRVDGPDGTPLGVSYIVVDVTDRWRAQQRLGLLSDAARHIGTTLDVATTAQELADAAVPALADFVAVDLLEDVLHGIEPAPGPMQEDPLLRRVGQRSTQDDMRETIAQIGEHARVFPNSPAAHAIVDGKAMLEAVLDPDALPWLASDKTASERVREIGLHTMMVVPIRARGTMLGVAHFFRRHTPNPFEPDDLILAEEFVSRAAVSIDNARRFTKEHAAALALQRSLLPHGLPVQSAVEVTSRYLPANDRAGVGGDWFDVIPLSGARVALVVGDVVGHGAHAAATMGRLRASVHTLADLDMPPDELLAHLDDIVMRFVDEEARGTDPDADAGEVSTAALGASCLYAAYDPVTRRCTMARAGHPPPAIVHPDGSVEFPDLPAGPPLGLGGLPFESAEFELPEGTLIVLYTDGLVGGSRGADIDQGLDRLRGALADADRPLDEISHAILATLADRPPTDDIALLVARTHALDATHVVTWDLPADPAVVSDARALVDRQLSEWDLDDAAFTTELVVSELVTNAIRYAAGPITLRLIRDTNLICEVSDGTATSPRLRHARTTDEGGRGLFLVSQFAQRWGTRYTADGKTIWAEQPLAPPE